MPSVRFAVYLPGGTNAATGLAFARPNITALDPVDDIEELLRQTKVLLVPSPWAEPGHGLSSRRWRAAFR
jgi:hypothetical protein